eukprot:5846059-Heterocapsa_arctica.AAC.1
MAIHGAIRRAPAPGQRSRVGALLATICSQARKLGMGGDRISPTFAGVGVLWLLRALIVCEGQLGKARRSKFGA